MQINVLSGLSDRIGAQAGLIKGALNSGMTTGTGFYERIHQGADQVGGDFFLENSFINDANNIDINTVSGTLFKSIYGSFIQDMDSYMVAKGFANTDAYIAISGVQAVGTLQGQGNLGQANAICSKIDVPANFEDVYFQVKGTHLSAGNVFFPQDNVKVSTYVATGSGTGTYTSNNPVGTNTGNASAANTNNAPARMLLIAGAVVGAAAAQVNLYLTAAATGGPGAGTVPAFANIPIPANTISGTQFPVNCSGQYLNCTNMVVAGGTNNDNYQVWAIKEREKFL